MSIEFNRVIEHLCADMRPQTIYLAIGCAHSAIQQVPPFLGSTPSLCVWIDPCLEAVPEGLALTGISPLPTSMAECEVLEGPTVTCVALRTHVHWTSSDSKPEDFRMWTECLSILYHYVQVRATNGAQLIVQDYSGANIYRFYPIQTVRREERAHFLSHVLFDVTYNEGGCFIDFDKVEIVRHPGSMEFFQPAYEPLSSIQWVAPQYLQAELGKRMNFIEHSVYRLYRTLEGREEARDYSSPESVLCRCSSLFDVYGLSPLVTDPVIVRRLLVAFFHDVASLVDYTHSETDTCRLLDCAEYIEALVLMRQLVVSAP